MTDTTGKTVGPWIGFAFVMMSIVALVVAISLPNAMLPAIESDLSMTHATGDLVWTLSFAALGAVMIPAGQIGDRIGRRRSVLLGMVAGVLALLLGAISPNSAVFLLSRILVGAATGLVAAPATGIVNVLFSDPHRRGIAFGVYGVAFGAGFALGPIVGALFLDAGGWRSALVAAATACGVIAVGVRATTPESGRNPAQRIDAIGAALLMAAVALYLVAIDQGGSLGWLETNGSVTIGPWDWTFAVSPVAVMLGLTGVLVGAMWLYERSYARRGGAQLFDPRILKIRSFSIATVAAMLYFTAVLPLFVIYPLVSQIVLQQSPMAMALTVSTLGAGVGIGGVLSGPLAERMASRTVLVLGTVLGAVALIALLPLLTTDLTPGVFAAALAVVGIPLGIAYARVTEVILHDVPKERSSHASGLMFGARSITGAIGSVVLIGAATLTAVHVSEAAALSQDPQVRADTAAFVSSIQATSRGNVSSGIDSLTISEFLESASDPVYRSIEQAYLDGVKLATVIAGGILLASALVALLIPFSKEPGA
jgi:MFS family permease